MHFTCYTEYDRHALTAMARVLRLTSRKKHSRRSHIFGYAVEGGTVEEFRQFLQERTDLTVIRLF